MRIIIQAPQRKKPRIGEIRTTKKHGKQIRVVETAPCGAWICSGNRYCYEWKTPEELIGTQWEYLLRMK